MSIIPLNRKMIQCFAILRRQVASRRFISTRRSPILIFSSLNWHAKTAASLGDLEKSCFYLQASVQAAKSGGYRIWQEEAYDVYLFLLQTWPHEKVVKNLLQPFW